MWHRIRRPACQTHSVSFGSRTWPSNLPGRKTTSVKIVPSANVNSRGITVATTAAAGIALPFCYAYKLATCWWNMSLKSLQAWRRNVRVYAGLFHVPVVSSFAPTVVHARCPSRTTITMWSGVAICASSRFGVTKRRIRRSKVNTTSLTKKFWNKCKYRCYQWGVYIMITGKIIFWNTRTNTTL